MHLLITGAWQGAAEHLNEIRAMGHEAVFLQQEKDALPCDPAWVEGIICNGFFLHHPISQFPNLRWIQLTSAGLDRVPLDEIRRRGIRIDNARGVYSIPMAEFAVAGVLSLYKDLGRFRENQKAHVWKKNRCLRELAGSTVVIVGCGSVGTECAKRFAAFDCKVIGVDPIVQENDRYSEIVDLPQLDDKLQEADVVVLTLPLTEETRGLINRRRLSLIHGVLVNIARGAIVDQEALTDWDGEAVIDVFEEEPLPGSSALWGKDGFVVTPHNCFVGDGNGKRLLNMIMNNLRSVNG